MREVQGAFGFRAVETARAHLSTLVREGRLAHRPGESRGFALPGTERVAGRRIDVPILGRVQAGELSTAVEDLEGYVPVVRPRGAEERELFALRVRGESMTGAGIFPDDLVIVRRQPRASSGEIVVALVEDEATVKRLRLRGRTVELHPENPAFDVIRIRPKDPFRLLGKIVEIRRYLS